MNRLQKKCLVASMAMHSLLLVILLVGPAFLSSTKVSNDLPVLDMIPSRLTDALFSGGGKPNAKPPPASPVAQPVQQPEPPTPQPPQPEPVTSKPPIESKPRPEPKPPKTEPTPVTVKAETSKLSTDKPKSQIKVNDKITTLKPKDLADAKAKKEQEQEQARARERELADARQRTAKEIDARLSGSLKSLSENLSSGTTIEMPGTGGGAAYANYAQVIKSIYDHAWIDPDEVSDNAATVKVKVVVARDGSIISDSITGRSGIPALDKSVQHALDRVRQLPPFPEGAKERERTFIINFNLKAKRLTG
jgi:TonB family protein